MCYTSFYKITFSKNHGKGSFSWLFSILILFIGLTSCEKDKAVASSDSIENTSIYAVDISSFPEIDQANTVFYNALGREDSFLNILSESGVNTIRLRVWVNPSSQHSSLNEVRSFSQTLKSKGFKIWISVHYSDTWADPGHQETPVAWQNQSIDELAQTVYDYTTTIVQSIAPDYIQIGNEINSGMLHPVGDLNNGTGSFLRLLKAGSDAVRDHSSSTKIMLHFAGIDGASWFFDQVQTIDYDMIGLSYYPIWHGKSLSNLSSKMQELAVTHNKEIVVAETAYPFTLDFNDFTNNIVGLESQLILPQFSPSPQGQKDFLEQIKIRTTNFDGGMGFCYWGAELVAWKGDQSTDASPWENQALFDFNHQALPVLQVFTD